MAKSSSNRFSALDYVLIHSSKRGRRGIFLTFLFVLLILVFGNVYFYIAGRNQLLEYVMLERQSVAELAATMIQERLYRVIDVGTSLATRVAFRDRVSEGNWDAAIEIMESVPEDFSYIDRVALFDPQGTFWAATSPTPEILSVIGENFSYRDYYQGVSKNWEPFVGEAIKPAVPLGYNLVPVAIPIKAESEEVLGFLLLNIKLDTLVVWAQNIDAGPEGFLYFVDHKGHLVAHPTLLPAEEIIDFSSDETVQKVLAGEAGAEVLVDQEKDKLKIVAYAPVPDFGWGVILEQPRAAALAPFFGNLLMSLVLQGVFLVVILVSLTFMMVCIERGNGRFCRALVTGWWRSIATGRSLTLTPWRKRLPVGRLRM